VRRLPRSDLSALAAILALAAALRLTGIRYGLPFGTLLNPDEANIVPRAWRMTHGGGPDPHWFDYPTLVLYLLAPLEWLAGAPSYLTARLVVVVLALATVAAAWFLGRAAYGAPAALVAAGAVAVDTTHVDYSRMAVTDVPLTLGVTVALALLVAGRIELAALAAGLAMSAKWPGAFLVVPLVIAAWGDWRRLARSLALAAVVFAATSPYALAHPREAWDDASRVQRRAREGWLGFEHDHATPLAFLDRLWEGMGPFLAVALVGLAIALVRRTRADLLLASFVLAYYANLLMLDAHFDRYVVPVVAPLAVLAGRFGRAPALLLVVPLLWSIGEAAEHTRTDTRVGAATWVNENVDARARIAVDPSTPALAERFDVVHLELPGPWRPFDRRRDVAELRRSSVRYVFVTGAVADRVLAARDRYPRESRFYDQLRTEGRRLYYADADDDFAGPWVAVYSILPEA
jgi:4-amino-4-deoxy-L-arabinose transferase-like glycosyltransferase